MRKVSYALAPLDGGSVGDIMAVRASDGSVTLERHNHGDEREKLVIPAQHLGAVIEILENMNGS